jgi:hypothetical protein
MTGAALRLISANAAVAWEAVEGQWLKGNYSPAYWDLVLPGRLQGLPKLL